MRGIDQPAASVITSRGSESVGTDLVRSAVAPRTALSSDDIYRSTPLDLERLDSSPIQISTIGNDSNTKSTHNYDFCNSRDARLGQVSSAHWTVSCCSAPPLCRAQLIAEACTPCPAIASTQSFI